MMPQLPQNTDPKARRRILAADDDPIMRELMMARLGDDVDVTCAENGEVAWEKLVAEDFDLAIIDLGMPKLDGFGLISFLRQTPKTVDLPIIVATSRGNLEAIEKAFACGATAFVTKPINWPLFKYTVQYTLKTGQIESQLRNKKSTCDLAIKSKDSLLSLLSDQLQMAIASDKPLVAKNRLLDAIYLSQLQHADRQPTFTLQNINDIIANTVINFQAIAAKKSVNLVGRQSLSEFFVDVEVSTWADALDRLVQAAIKSSPVGGTVEIMTGTQHDGSLVVSVRDNGEATCQSDINASLNVLLTQTIGLKSGELLPDLSLPIVRQCAEIHHGRVLFQSSTGQGNVSALWLPADRIQISQQKKLA